jgi:hypothetical protein
MKRLFIILVTLFALLIFSGCGSSSKSKASESERDRMKLSSDVKSVRSTTFKAQDSFGTIEKTEFVSDELIVFDPQGNLIEQYFFNDSGKPTFKGYITKGKFIDSAISVKPSGYLKGRYVYENDETGKLLVHSYLTPDGTLTYKYTNSYDDYGNLVEVTEYGSDGTITSKELNSYDSDNKLIEKHTVDGSGRKTSRIEYEYDSTDGKINLGNKCIAQTEYDGNDIPQLEREFRYDTWGNCTMELIDDYDVQTRFEMTYKYDDKGNWISVITKRNGVLTEITERKFNEEVPENLQNLQNTASPDRRIPEIFSTVGSIAGFPAENLFDGNPATAWIYKYSEGGHLPSINFSFPEPRDIDIIVISNGYIKNEDSWASYGKLTTVYIDYPNNHQGWIQHDLNPNLKKQIIPIHQKNMRSLELILGSVVPGTKSSDIAISDIWFY